VRASPSTKRAAGPLKKQTRNVPSTNVSSPVRAPKQSIRQFTYAGDDEEDEDYYDKPQHPTRNQRAHGHLQTNIGDDDSDSNSGFAPVRQAKPIKRTAPKGLGNPIIADERTAGLSELQTDVLRDFLDGAKNLRQAIMVDKGYRQAIFSDTILREMGLQLPKTLKQMSAIKGIRPEMVELYGKRFLPLIENTRGCYAGQLPKLTKINSRRPPTPVDEDDEERPMDKNHQIVIDLCDSGDEITANHSEDESNYSFVDDDDDQDDDAGFHTSHHFTQQVDPEVEAYNRRMAEIQGPSGGGSASASKANKKTRQPRSSTSYNKSKYSGVKKRTSSGGKRPKGGHRKSGGNGGGSGGGSSWGGIMAMPT
jgi:bloom syndrome protein